MKNFAFLVLLTLSFSLFGYIPGLLFKRGPLDIIITKSANLSEHKSNIYDYFYKDRKGKYEIGLFVYAMDKNEDNNQIANMEMEFYVISGNVMMYIGGPTTTVVNLEIDTQRVKNEIKADVGISTLIDYNGTPSGFINYNYVVVNRYLKINKGFIMEIIMFNDIELVNDKQFNEDIKIFKFE